MNNKVLSLLLVALLVLIIFSVYNNTKMENNNRDRVVPKGMASVSNPVTSPSGKYLLKINEVMVDGVKHNQFAVYKVSKGLPETTPVFASKDVFRTRDVLFFLWDSKDRVWVYSGDIGTFYWEYATGDIWDKHSYADNKNIQVPSLLKSFVQGE